MNPVYSLADWVSYRGTLSKADFSTYPWLTFRVLGHLCCARTIAVSTIGLISIKSRSVHQYERERIRQQSWVERY